MCVCVEEWGSYATGRFCRLMITKVSILVMFQLKKKKKGGQIHFLISQVIFLFLVDSFFFLMESDCSVGFGIPLFLETVVWGGNCSVISKEISIKSFNFIYVSQ